MLMLTVRIECDMLKISKVLLLACFPRYVNFLQMRELPHLRKQV